jgi:hypothetical protein
MTRRGILRWSGTLGFIVLLAGILFAQTVPDRPLIINGKTAQAPVVQMNGRSYVELESLAQALNATVAFEEKRVVLTIPAAPPADATAASASATPPEEPPAPPAPQGMSRPFASSAIAALSQMREWRGAITVVISYGVPVTGAWPQDYHDRAETMLHQATIAAMTDDDQNALQLLQNEFSNIEAWADNIIGARQALNAAPFVDPNALQNDTQLAKISTCGNFLSNMIVSGMFSDDSSCH